MYIPKKLQNAIFCLPLFETENAKKVCSSAGYDALFSSLPSRQSNRPKLSFFRGLGYQLFSVLKKGLMIYLFSFCAFSAVTTPEAIEPSEGFFFPVKAPQASFVLSGLLTNENGEHYDYFFQIQRDGHAFHAKVALFDSQHQKVIFEEAGDAQIEHPDDYDWHIGRAFLRFNAINDSWVFGLVNDEKGGFNFKVDMLNQREHHTVTRYFRHGISFVVMQTGALNGHLQLADQEQFVIAKTAWFRQIWLTRGASSLHQLDGLLCRFQDGGGLYSVRVLESDMPRGSVSGLLSAEGETAAISQFIHVEEKDNHAWLIRVLSPHMQLNVASTLAQQDVVAGFMMSKERPGFCLLSRDVMGSLEEKPPIATPKPNILAKSTTTVDNPPMCTRLWC